MPQPEVTPWHARVSSGHEPSGSEPASNPSPASARQPSDPSLPPPPGWRAKLDLPQITLRATLAGLAIGSIVLVSNFQFGLQTGWVSMMLLPSALLGFAAFKLSPFAKDFTDVENVYIQSVAVAVGTGPLAYGLIGIVPAIEKFVTEDESGLGRKLVFSLPDLLVWSLGLAMFGVFFAIPLRRQVVVEEKLPFPSGSATATLILVLHGTEVLDEKTQPPVLPAMLEAASGDAAAPKTLPIVGPRPTAPAASSPEYRANIHNLVLTFAVSATYTVASFFFPFLQNIPLFGRGVSLRHKWNFQPSPAYIGQGIIMGLPTVSYMLFGAVLGWGVLAPLAEHQRWATGPIDDWIHGAQGWILWISLSVMISDSLVLFLVVVARSARDGYRRVRAPSRYLPLLPKPPAPAQPDVPRRHLVSNKVTVGGLVVLSLVCMAAVRVVFGALVPHYATATAIALALLFLILGVRALGETDLNPVSGIGKLLQLIFAVVIPRLHPLRVLINLIAGGIAEAGAQQAGDLMQDLKTGHLLGASPRAQFVAQVIGTLWLVLLSSTMYKVYNLVYKIPSQTYRIPTAIIWVDCARLVTGEGLPPRAFEFLLVFGVVFGLILLLKNTVPKLLRFWRYLVYLPNGVAVGIGIYNTPNFTLARFVGGALAYWWIHVKTTAPDSRIHMIIFSSGLVLGEGLLSGFTMLLTSLGVGPLQ